MIIGEEEVTYNIHEDLLVKASDFFDKALNSGFKEGHEKKVILPEASAVSILRDHSLGFSPVIFPICEQQVIVFSTEALRYL